MPATAVNKTYNKEPWPPMLASFEPATKNGRPAIKLNLAYDDADITEDDDNPRVVIKAREELEEAIKGLRRDLDSQFYGNFDPENDPDVALMQTALASLDQG